MHDDVSRRTALKAIGLGLGGVATGVGTVSASHEVVTLFDYDPAAGELPENVAVDRRGGKYVSFPALGEVRWVSPDNRRESTLATFEVGEGIGVLGLEVHPRGTLFACVVSDGATDSDAHGIWSVSRRGQPSLFAGLDSATFPNDLTLWGRSLLVTDSAGGRILRVRDGASSEWVADPSLEGDGSLGFGIPLGANGIARGSDGTVYVANTELGQVVEIPPARGGAPPTPSVFVADERLRPIDGLAIDAHDDLYAAIIGQDAVVRITQDREIETLATADDGMDNPSDVTFGTGRGERRDLLVTNYALLSGANPSLAKLHVGVPGLPVRP